MSILEPYKELPVPMGRQNPQLLSLTIRDEKLIERITLSLHDRDRNKTLESYLMGQLSLRKMAELLNLKGRRYHLLCKTVGMNLSKIKMSWYHWNVHGAFLFMILATTKSFYGTPSVNNANLITLAEPTKQNVENMA